LKTVGSMCGVCPIARTSESDGEIGALATAPSAAKRLVVYLSAAARSCKGGLLPQEGSDSTFVATTCFVLRGLSILQESGWLLDRRKGT
jgi:hypothetical protein